LAVLIVMLLGWVGFPAVRRSLGSGTAVQPTAVAEIARATTVPTNTTEVSATPSASPTNAGGQEGGAPSAAAAAVESGEALANPIPESSATPTEVPAIPVRVDSSVPESTPSQEPRPTVVPTRTVTARPTQTPTAVPTPTATAKPTQKPTSSPTPTATRVQPTATATRVLPTATATRVQSTPTATRISQRPPSPTPIIAVPSLVEPSAGGSTSGMVAFKWQSASPLPLGAAYEVVVWNSGEDPTTARGVAATTADTTLTADLNALYSAGLLKAGETFWTVLIVQADPYVRLSQPAVSSARTLIYQAPGGDGGGPAGPPPKP